MSNQRKKGIERVTLTLPDELLSKLENAAEERGVDRLSFLREILAKSLAQEPKLKPRRSS